MNTNLLFAPSSALQNRHLQLRTAAFRSHRHGSSHCPRSVKLDVPCDGADSKIDAKDAVKTRQHAMPRRSLLASAVAILALPAYRQSAAASLTDVTGFQKFTDYENKQHGYHIQRPEAWSQIGMLL
jgi:hypothetical protein